MAAGESTRPRWWPRILRLSARELAEELERLRAAMSETEAAGAAGGES